MPLENSFDNIDDLNPDWPLGVDPKSEGANNLRGVKRALQGNVTGDGLETRLQGGGVADAFTVGELVAALKGLLLEVNGTGNPDTPVAVRVLGDAGGLQLGIGANGDISLAQLDAAGVAESTRVFLERDGPSIAGAGEALYADVPEGAETVTLGQRINFSTVAAIVAAAGSVVMQASWGAWLSAAQSLVIINSGGAGVFRVFPTGAGVRRTGSVDALLGAWNSNQGGIGVRVIPAGNRYLTALDGEGVAERDAIEVLTTPAQNSYARVVDAAGTGRPIGFNVLPYTPLTGTHTPVDDWSGQRYSFTAAGVVQLTGTAAVGCITTFTNAHTAAIPINQSGSGVIRWFSGNGMLVGNRSLAPGGVMTAHKSSATEWHIWGAGIS
jgi:hypothetical protein